VTRAASSKKSMLKSDSAPAVRTEPVPPVQSANLSVPETPATEAPAPEPKIESVKSPTPVKAPEKPAEKPLVKDAPATAAELARAARPTSSGSSSLTRALGLKLNRIVLDAGHGGHDQGSAGPKGLLEKDLVLDVTMRLGKLIEQGLGAEVIYTRSDDTFIPLEGRTAIANEKKADLFLSIHANSSQFPRISGVETYYLNFTDSKEAMDLAARENAASQRSIFELQDLLHKITLHEKIDESREFANRIQGSLFSLSTRNFPGLKNRGVKKAPFVVLIGAQMPSVLAEIGFVTSTKEEQLLNRPDYRQKLAESLYKGISRYAESLSHYQLAQIK
jgi:N-acetylmuramoyl-L-alanine amidase